MKRNFKDYEKKAELLKVLSHPVRLCIVNGLIQRGGCNVSYMQECMNIPQSSVSQHLQKLKSAGVIEGKRKGTQIEYYILDPIIPELIETLLKEDKNE